MYIHLNVEGVVIDATLLAKFVTLNKNGSKYLTPSKKGAVGILSSKDIIRNLVEKVISPDWYTVSQVIPVLSLPEDYVPNKYRYVDGEFVLYEGIAPATNYELTEAVNTHTEDISITQSGLMETYEETEANTNDIAECRAAIEELYEMM